MSHQPPERPISQRELARLIQESGIDECGELSSRQLRNLSRLAADGRLTVQQIDWLAADYPRFVNTNLQAIDNLRQIAASAQASQQSALGAIERMLIAPWHPQGALAQAAHNAQTDQARLEIADIFGEVSLHGLAAAQTIERMNQDNNLLWRWMSGTAAALAGLAAIAVVAVLVLAGGGDRSDRNS